MLDITKKRTKKMLDITLGRAADVIMDIHYNVVFFVRASPSPYIRDIGLYPFRSLFFISFIPI
jgi:hypothetical protein